MAKRLGVTIKHYHADKSSLTYKQFIKRINNNRQTISYSGVGAHLQDGIAERRIRDLQERRRTITLPNIMH
jgi:hypothetical protein